MHKILVVDDEPRVSTGIKNFLLGSELNIAHVETALNGFEAVDYLRMETFDLVLTDIQMSRMSGIELMETIYMEQPHLPVIVISAHEKFDFAKKSLRLGARDYLVKPVERDDLLRVVGSVLRENETIGRQSLALTEAQRAGRGKPGMGELLAALVTEGDLPARDGEALAALLGDQALGGLFGVVSIRPDLTRGGFSDKEIALSDRKLLKYASINILNESLGEWRGLSLSGYGNEIVAILRLDEPQEDDRGARIQSQLHLIGQMIHMNLKSYLNVETTVGISSLHADVFMLPKLMDEAKAAAEWRHMHPGQRVFYFEDRKARENLGIAAWIAQVDAYAQALKANAGEVRPDGAELLETLRLLQGEPEIFNSYFGMLAYRLYGLLLEQGRANGMSLHRFDPDAYFRGADADGKLAALAAYVPEVAEMLGQLAQARDRSILARITGFIRQRFRDPALKIQDIAGEVHFSTAYLSYLFKRETGQNLWDYVTELRIEEAKYMLETTDKKRYEIAYAVGYESPEHFGRMFKRYAGLSPAEYRKERQGDGG
ncbi:response regulator [Cohnella sp. JJ-181]|uniref:response regulator n=1 Tax=Cohnella rhizoplanae TaxID=2974897 RepID=UPI0022FF6341|nr:response regulator [Cohnella sp. JJ-181]CAI6078652.1 Regulator of RpoS [Cohnella sp. JJ-181]